MVYILILDFLIYILMGKNMNFSQFFYIVT